MNLLAQVCIVFTKDQAESTKSTNTPRPLATARCGPKKSTMDVPLREKVEATEHGHVRSRILFDIADGDGREVKKETPGEMHFRGEQQDLQRRTPKDDHGNPDRHRDTGYPASATNNTIGTETHRKKERNPAPRA